ncbi:MAG: hypothetical protein ABF296_08355 [Oceanococcaceae bacterium]
MSRLPLARIRGPVLVLLLSVSLGGCALWASEPGTATSAATSSRVESMTVPRIDLAAARTDAPPSRKGEPLAFADAVAVDISPATTGAWSAWDEHHDRWRVDLHSPNAKSLNLHFDRFALPAGAQLRLYPPSAQGQRVVLDVSDNKSHGALWTPQMAGDTLRLDLILPRERERRVDLHLATVNIAW